MHTALLIKNGKVVNNGTTLELDILIEGNIITRIAENIHVNKAKSIDAEGMLVLPGIIDDHVHFREPGLTRKGSIETESKAAVAGGITSFFEMPNTIPNTTSFKAWKEKNDLAKKSAWANYGFYIGATDNNTDVLMDIDKTMVPGVKVFMGSSTGDMLVDDDKVLSTIFSKVEVPIAVHSEDELIVKKALDYYKQKFSNNYPYNIHTLVRSREACVKSTERAIALCESTGGHLHLIHVSTMEEIVLINDAKLKGLNITAEVCLHHLWFEENDYRTYGNLIKWNPSIKGEEDRTALRNALNDGVIDVVGTDHAPHLLTEKMNTYFSAPSGGPMVQHSLPGMLELVKREVFCVEDVVKWMCHNPAKIFNINKRGYIKEGYFADIVIVNPDDTWQVKNENILYKCGWSPFEGMEFSHKVDTTIINGKIIFTKNRFIERGVPQQITFNR